MTEFQSDIKITNNDALSDTSRATLQLSPTGDIQLVDGKNKLQSQILRTIVNDATLTMNLLNNPVPQRAILAYITILLRNFKQVQIGQTKRSDPNLNGFSIFRKASGSNENFSKISTDIVTYSFIDTKLINNTTYTYGFTKTTRGVFETSFLEKLDVTPTNFNDNAEVVIGDDILAIPGDGQVTFYVNYTKMYKGSELLMEVKSINIIQDQTDPRRFIVQVQVKDYNGSITDLSARSFILNK